MVRIMSLISVLAAAILISASAPEDLSTPQGGTFRFGLSTDPSSLDPHIHSGVAAQAVRLCVYNGLVSYYKKTEIIPELATSWETPSDTRWVFNLREGVTFHNGDPFSAEDVKYSFERIMNQDTGATLYSQLKDVEEVNIIDDYTIEFRLKRLNAAFLSTLALSEAAIVSKTYMESGGDLSNTMMGTGPFMFTERQMGKRIVVDKNPNFFREDLPYLNSIEFIPYPDEESRIIALKSGEIDLAAYIPWARMAEIENNPDLTLKSGAGPFMYMMFNPSEKPFDNPKVRKALGYAVNRKAIIDTAFFGRGEPLYGPPVYKDAWFYQEELSNYFEYNPEKAKELLAEAGYPDGFSTSITGTSTYGMLKDTTQVIQQNLEAVGLDVEIELFDWASTVDKWQNGSYEMIAFGTVPDPMDPDFYSKFFASGSSHYSAPTGYQDAEVDRLLEEGRSTGEQSERRRIYMKLEKHLLETSPWLYLTWREQGEAVREYVKGYDHLPGALAFMSPITLREVWLEE